jgi:hypothetical protein
MDQLPLLPLPLPRVERQMTIICPSPNPTSVDPLPGPLPGPLPSDVHLNKVQILNIVLNLLCNDCAEAQGISAFIANTVNTGMVMGIPIKNSRIYLLLGGTCVKCNCKMPPLLPDLPPRELENFE